MKRSPAALTGAMRAISLHERTAPPWRTWLPIAAIVCLTACQSPPAVVPGATAPSVAPAPAASVDIVRRYAVRADASDIRVLVFRAGTFARLGHNHVIVARDVTGEVQLARDFRRSSFSLDVPLASFDVDPPAARADEGEAFGVQPDAQAVQGTRANMLGPRVLDAAAHPNLHVQSLALTGPEWAPDITLRIALHGVEREIGVPVALDIRDDLLIASAVFEVRQSDFGITPLSILGGAIAVADTVRVRLRIVARRIDDASR